VYRYGQYCPVARAAEILADRWTVLIVRELLVDVRHFNELERGLPRMSRTLLTGRLRRLEEAGVLERRAAPRGKRTEYRLTAAGRELKRLVDSLCDWGARWAFGPPRREELDPIVLLWWIRRRVCFDRLPRRRIVIQFDFQGGARRTYWLLIEPTEASICLKHPGFDIDLTVVADLATLYQVWLGRVPLDDAVRRRRVRLEGAPADVRAFPTFFAGSGMAASVRAALADPTTAASRQRRPAAQARVNA
jgi:DNA-binding HxlR family transcriptional regulator